MKRISTSDNPMEENIIHLMLVTTNRLQMIPAPAILVLLVCFSIIASISWGADALEAGALHLTASLINWLSLWMLPVMGRSFGPDRPSTLILSALFSGLVLILGLVNAPLWVVGIFALLMIAAVIYSTWIEPFRLGVTHEHYHYQGWESDKPPLRVLQVGDIHIERITARERRLNALLEELQPDVIVFTGDFVNISYTNDPQSEADIRQIISQWHAPYGVYSVPGTHTVEPLQRVREFVAGLDNLRLLENEWVRLETPAGTLNILGMVTTHLLRADQVTVQQLMAEKPGPGMSLLVTHAPDVAPEADASGYDLYVCGHTHGGQIRFPIIGAVFSGSALGLRYVMGRYDLNQMTLYTARGVGLEGMGAPRARFLCPPEIILWEISG